MGKSIEFLIQNKKVEPDRRQIKKMMVGCLLVREP